MADGFKISDGYVEIHGVVDRRAVIVAADQVTRGVSDQMTTGVAFSNLREGGRKMGAVLGEHAGPSAAKGLTAGLAGWIDQGASAGHTQTAGQKLGGLLGTAGGSTFVEEIIKEIDRRARSGRTGGNGGDGGNGGGPGPGGDNGDDRGDGRDRLGRFTSGGQGGRGGKGGDARTEGRSIGAAMGAAALTGFLNTFTSGFKGIGSLIANNPILGTVAIGIGSTLAILAAPAFASAFSAALIGGAGLGVIGLGAFILKDDPEVRAAASSLGKTAKETLRAAAEPMKEPLIGAMGIFEQMIRDVGPDLTEMFMAIAPAIEPLARGLSGFVKEALPGFIELMKVAAPFLSDLENTLPRFGEHVGQFLSIIAEAGPAASLFFRDFLHIIGIVLVTFGYVIEGLSRMYAASRDTWLLIGDLFRMAALGILAAVKDMISFFGRLRDFIAGVWRTVKQDTGSAIAFFREMPGKVVSALSSIPGKVKGIFSGAGQWLVDAGRNIIAGLINGIKGMIPSLSGALGAITNMIPDWKGPAEKDRKLLEPSGRMIMDGLLSGIRDRVPDVQADLTGLTSAMPAMVAPPANTPVAARAPITINLTVNALDVGQIPERVTAALYDALDRYEKSYA